MKRENLRDYLNPKPAERAAHQSSACELSLCRCEGRGGPDIAIQDHSGVVIGYVCQTGYLFHLASRGLDQLSQVKQTGSPINRKSTSGSFADVVARDDALAARKAAHEADYESWGGD